MTSGKYCLRVVLTEDEREQLSCKVRFGDISHLLRKTVLKFIKSGLSVRDFMAREDLIEAYIEGAKKDVPSQPTTKTRSRGRIS
jgi:hypothetical protein